MNYIPDKPPLRRTIVVKCPGCLSTARKDDGRGHVYGKPRIRHKKRCRGILKQILYSYDGVTWARNGALLAMKIEQSLAFKAAITGSLVGPRAEKAKASLDKSLKALEFGRESHQGFTGEAIPITYMGQPHGHAERPMRRKAAPTKEVKIPRPVHYHTCIPCSEAKGREVKWACACDQPMWRRKHVPCPMNDRNPIG